MTEARDTLFETLELALENKQYHEFTKILDRMNAVDVAEYLETLRVDRLITAFRLLKKNIAADIFAELDTETREKIILATTDADLGLIVDELFVDDAVDLLEELPAGMVKRILRATKPETRRLVNKFLSYPEDSAGSVMTAEYIDLEETMTVTEAVECIRRTGVDKETVYVAYITDSARRLLGIVTLRDLLFADGAAQLRDIMSTDIAMANTTDDREEVAAIISKYDLLVLPIGIKKNGWWALSQ